MIKIFKLFSILSAAFLLSGFGRPGFGSSGELRADLRLKIYNEAIAHYEKAKSLDGAGKTKEAIAEIGKATKVFRNFPEAYELARMLYLKRGLLEKAREQESLFLYYGGNKGASLYELRDKLAREWVLQEASLPPPDLELFPSFFFSGLVAILLILGLFLEYRRFTFETGEAQQASIFLESFPNDEEREAVSSWLFKLGVLCLPAPFLFSFLVFLGVRRFADLIPLFLFSWVIVAVGIYLIFFADLSDLNRLRRPGGGMG